MADLKKLERWAEKLLDTGKRNNLISFKDAKASTAEVVFPDSEKVFSKCSVGHTFEIFDPRIPDDEEEREDKPDRKLSRDEYKDYYSSRIRSNRFLLVYAQTPNPLTAVKNIAKKAQALQDETGINVAYLAFGFVKWREKETSDIFYRAPLLLVHINIIKGSILDPVKIEITDDDVVVNPTFNYLLQADFGMKLPDFEDGDSLISYYSKVTEPVRKLGWEVIDECKMGIFSFLKINMYEDLKKNAEKILENENIKVLLGEQVGGNIGFSGFEHVVENPLIDLHTVVDADSSQIEAIEMAKSGNSFVLQGPPGTGKSQTITNIIAECLHDGKKVLFVSEKQAALNVVFDKLKKAGLADFCLELHSHKANKKAVIEELNRTLEVPRSTVSSSADEEIRQKKEAQNKLDRYAVALHEKRDTINKSLYQLFELFSAERDYPELKADIRDIGTKGSDYLIKAVKILEQYAEYVASVGADYRDNVWYGFNNPGISFDEKNQLMTDMESVCDGYKDLQSATIRIKAKYETPDLNYSDTLQWQSLLDFSAGSDVITPSMLTKDVCEEAVSHFIQMKELSQNIIPVRDQVLQEFDPVVINELDGKDLYTKLSGQFSGLFSRLFNGEYKTLIAGVNIYAKGEKIKYRQAVEFSERLMSLQSMLAAYGDHELAVNGCIGSCYDGPDTDWDHVMEDLDTLKDLYANMSCSFGSLPEMAPGEFCDNQDSFRADADELSNKIAIIESAKNRIKDQFAPEIMDLDTDSYEYCIKKMDGCIRDFDKLGNWISFMEILDQIEKIDLKSYIDGVIDNEVKPEDVAGAYRRAFYKQWIEFIIFTVPELSSFSRIKQDQAVKSFVSKDKLQYEISKLQIRSELSQQRPNLDLVAGGSQIAILRREGQKKRKQMPIRRLLEETGSLVQIIKPCFLMSPLSVSTFLNSKVITFDTVVFDEASQIFPQDAVGAIYRGKQAIVVGDSRQMPPSNFFNTATEVDDEDEEVGDVTDFESILDICSSVFNTERLAWHYRSHYEQLIAFSNRHFYNNNLVTFPSSSTDHEGIGVDYHFAGGIFDRRSRTNRAEAEYIVNLVYNNIEQYPDRSLGVVAFSVAQQTLIDNLISRRRESDTSYEWFFKEDRAEPFFVKNLETVQGDERDTIIFSVAYAKDSQGRFIHNFGPLNKEGGERRLNVAITRAKENVQLVASIHHTDINLANSKAEGVRLLRAYLDYAQNGEHVLERDITVSGDDQFDSYFEQEVCDYLRDQGFTVDTQVGCSGYRIDLGLRRPDSSDYVLAIECDGATYHSSKNARDRDSLRQRVLENMGWKFYRIWSTDWYRNKAIEKDRLVKAAREATTNIESSDTDHVEQAASNINISEVAMDRFMTETTETDMPFPEYVQVDAMRIIQKNPFDFQGAIYEILKTEAPLSEDNLLKRIVQVFDREKVTKVVVQEFDSMMYRCGRKGIYRKDGFLYLKDIHDYKLRIPGDKREIRHISKEELADGIYSLVKTNVEVSRDGVYRMLTEILGFKRIGKAITSKYDEAVEWLLSKNRISEDDGMLRII